MCRVANSRLLIYCSRCSVQETEVKVSPDDKPQRGECPNSWNKFHTCVDYCKERWGANITQEKSNKSKVCNFSKVVKMVNASQDLESKMSLCAMF